jgi:hypothetical protein
LFMLSRLQAFCRLRRMWEPFIHTEAILGKLRRSSRTQLCVASTGQEPHALLLTV